MSTPEIFHQFPDHTGTVLLMFADEVKVAHGIVASWLKRVQHTLEMAPGSHPITESKDLRTSDNAFVPLGNGDEFVLN